MSFCACACVRANMCALIRAFICACVHVSGSVRVCVCERERVCALCAPTPDDASNTSHVDALPSSLPPSPPPLSPSGSLSLSFSLCFSYSLALPDVASCARPDDTTNTSRIVIGLFGEVCCVLFCRVWFSFVRLVVVFSSFWFRLVVLLSLEGSSQ